MVASERRGGDQENEYARSARAESGEHGQGESQRGDMGDESGEYKSGSAASTGKWTERWVE